MNNKKYHAHFTQIFYNIATFFFLLIIPVARVIIHALTTASLSTLRSSWIDILTVALIITLGVLRYQCTYFYAYEKKIVFYSGVFTTKKTIIPYENIATSRYIYKYFLRPFKAGVLCLDTAGGNGRNFDFQLAIKESDYKALMKYFINEQNNGQVIYKTNPLYILLFSLISTNSFAGIVIVTTFISRSGEILGERFESLINVAFRNIIGFIAIGIPPAALGVAYFIFFSWLVAFCFNVFRHRNLAVRRMNKQLKMTAGIFTKREYALKLEWINYLDIKQTFLTYILGLYTISVNAVGYQKEKSGLEVLIPSAVKKDYREKIKALLPSFVISEGELRPNLGAFFRYTADPLYPCVFFTLFGYLIYLLFPMWGELVFFMTLTALIPSLWFFAVRVIDWLTSSVGYAHNYYTLRYSSGFYLHTVVMPKEKLMSVRIQQSVFQKFDNRCDAFFYGFSEKKLSHRIRNIDKAQLSALLEKSGYINEIEK